MTVQRANFPDLLERNLDMPRHTPKERRKRRRRPMTRPKRKKRKSRK